MISPDGLGRLGMTDTGGIFPLAARMDAPPPPRYGDGNVPEWVPDDIVEASRADDVDGAGIFDARNNVHQGQGIFESKWSLPGYAARETGLGPSEVIDAQTDTPIEVFLTGFWNSRPMHGQVQHRWPLAQGTEVPNHLLSAERIDYQRGVESEGRWNNPQPGSARPIHPTWVKPDDWGMGPPVAARPSTQLMPYDPPLFPPVQHQGPVSGLGDFGLDSGNLWTWAVAGVVAGAALAVAYDYAKGQGWI